MYILEPEIAEFSPPKSYNMPFSVSSLLTGVVSSRLRLYDDGGVSGLSKFHVAAGTYMPEP